MGELKMCFDQLLPEKKLVEASMKAIEERPDNEPDLPPLGPNTTPMGIAALTGKLWRPGRTLRVRFLDGDPKVQQKVAEVAQIWCDHANIKFDFGKHTNAEIRISFKYAGSWSYMGTDAFWIARSKPTMNYGWLRPNTDDEEYSRVVLHEFGHALGCIHEHQNPAAHIPWDEAKVIAAYSGPPNNWTEDQIRHNVLRTYDRTLANFSTFDEHSIMLYPIPNELTIGDYEVPWRNSKLSEHDKEFIAKWYPK